MTITVKDKKDFIKWVVKNYTLQSSEATWLLTYLHSDDILLEHIHFVEEANLSKRTLVMSTTCVKMKPFVFYNKKKIIYNVEEAFLEIVNCVQDLDEDIYICLFYKDRNICPDYNYMCDKTKKNKKVGSSIGLMTEKVLEESIQVYKITQIMKSIDKALDDNDIIEFTRLSNEYNNIVNNTVNNDSDKISVE